MTTLNTIIEEENTPDTEWEKDLRIRYHSQTLKMAEEVSKTGDYSRVEGMIVDWWLKELSSRDTYWKERVRKEVYEKSWDESGKGDRLIEVSTVYTLLDNLK